MNESLLITVESIMSQGIMRSCCSKIFVSFAITNNSSAPCVWTDVFIISHARVADTM